MTNAKRIVLSAGGTGGHLFPAAALARELILRGYDVELFTDRRGQKYATVFGDVPVHVLPAGTVRAGLAGKITGLAGLAAGILAALILLLRRRPAVVVGFGGYPSVPGVLAAQLLKIPTLLHEQNAVLGKANKLLARQARRVALSLAVVGQADARNIVTGNPVRAEIAALADVPYPAPVRGGPLYLFVMGGSQGSSVFAQVVPQALAKFSAGIDMRLHVTQQCRADDIETVRGIYETANIAARLETFFTDVPEILAASHLVISRSGASTVAELTAAGRPAIFVPYPHHADQQQLVNANAVAVAGGGWIMQQGQDFTADALAGRLGDFLQDPHLLAAAAAASRACGKPDAAARLAEAVIEAIS